jgi:hypothetical protein
MLRIPGKLGAIFCEFMLDTGANKSYVDRSFVHRHGSSVTSKPEPVTLANGETVFKTGPYHDNVPLHVLPLHCANVILGADWLQVVGAEISYTGGTVTVHCPNGSRATLVAGSDRTKEFLLSPCSLSAWWRITLWLNCLWST